MKWKNHVEYIDHKNAAEREYILNKLGSDGWELVSIDDHIAYLKKPF